MVYIFPQKTTTPNHPSKLVPMVLTKLLPLFFPTKADLGIEVIDSSFNFKGGLLPDDETEPALGLGGCRF
jgi:hypothetical protein